MRTTTTTLIAALSVVALLGVGVAAAATTSTTTDPSGANSGSPQEHQGWLQKLRAHFRFFHKHPWAAIDKVCDGNVTINECKALMKEKVQDLKANVRKAAEKRYDQCLQSRSKDYCDGRYDEFKADHPGIYGRDPAPAGNSTAPAPSSAPSATP